MNDSSRHRQAQPTGQRNEVILFHLEEASTHLAAARALVPDQKHFKVLGRIGGAMKHIYNFYAPPSHRQ